MTNGHDLHCELGKVLSRLRLAVVCPMANEIDTAESFVRDVLAQCAPLKEVLFLAIFDHACKDGTVDRLRAMSDSEPRLHVVWAPEDRCPVDAYLRGYRDALETGFEWILEIDAGYSHRPDDLPRFFPFMAQGVEAVFATRMAKGGRADNMPFKRRLISNGGTLLTNFLLGTSLTDMTSGFEMFSREALVRVLNRGIQSRGHFFQTEIKVYCKHMRIAEVPIRYSSPSSVVSGKVLKDALYHLWRLFALRLSGKL